MGLTPVVSSIYLRVYTFFRGEKVLAKVFKSGNSQAVRLPKEFRLDVSEVEIFKRGDELVLRPKTNNLSQAFKLLIEMPEDFLSEGRQDNPPQDRDQF